MNVERITVSLNDRARLAGALLAAGEWPAREQAAKPYKPHRAAEAARRRLAALAEHPAVQHAQAIAGEVDGPGAARLYAFALGANWPEGLGQAVDDFAAAAQLDDLWLETEADWQAAAAEAAEVLARADLGAFLADLVGPAGRPLVFVPNLLYPGLRPLVAETPEAWVLCQPPPPAWGTSLPWRYNERPDEVLAVAAEALAAALLSRALPDPAAAAPAGLAAAVLFLREAEGQAAADQFMLMEKKTRGLPHLPAVVEALAGVLADRRAGREVDLGALFS